MPAPNSKNFKKRPALSQAGPAAKKAHIAAAKSDPAPKKRARPVVPVEESEASEDDSDTGNDVLEEGDADMEDADADAEMDVDGGLGGEGEQKQVKDPNAARESHKAQKVLHEQRKAQKPHSELLTSAKSTWALARQKEIPKQEREKHIKALMNVIRGKVQEIVFKHDASRIVQTAVKHGNQSQRDEIAVELKGRYKELAQNKYSKFLVTKLIKLCPTHRLSILTEFQSSVIRLLLHREASGVIADSFELHANAYERAVLLRDFYGRETALFSITTGSEQDKEKSRKGLKGVLEGADLERRKRVLAALKENLVTIFNNPDKGSLRWAIVHRALLEYLMEINEIPDEAERDKLRHEILESCEDNLADMVHTKDGSRAVREFLVQGTAKDRKQIVKNMKEHARKMAQDDSAQLALFTALDVIDDTKMLAKTLIPAITLHASDLYQSSHGCRSLLYPIIPRSRRTLTPAIIATLAETDPIRAKTSKKDADVRAAEVRAAASADLLAWVAKDGKIVSRDTAGSLVVMEVMLEADGDKSAATESLLQSLMSSYPSLDPTKPHPIDLPHTSRLYKTLLQGGHFSHTTKSIEPCPRWSAKDFAESFVRIIGKERTLEIAKGGGAFVVAELLERIRLEGSEDVKETVKGWAEGLEQGPSAGEGVKGWNVLVEKVKALRN